MGSIAADQAATERVRLHITPFNPELLNKIIAPSILPLASNISFHSEQTYPERGFGYVELPVMAAQKVKQKLNGSTLKGSKVRIEEAKPERKRKAEEDDEVDDGGEDAIKARKMAKREKRKREEGVLSGHELGEGRRVKRGWTDGDAKDSKRKAKPEKNVDGLEGAEGRKLRFKTSVPPNAVPLAEEAKDKPKKKKDQESRRAKKKTVVKEFDKTKKSRDITINSGNNLHGALKYEDGKGWVDEGGAVVEAERESKKPKRRTRHEHQKPSLHDSANGDHDMGQPEQREPGEEASEEPMDQTGENESADEVAAEELPDQQDPIEIDTKVNNHHATQTEHQQPSTPSAPEVHPLEALFKKPAAKTDSASKPRPGPIDTSFNSFNFFDPQLDQEDEDVAMGMPPQTPHTKRDLEWRSLRSAAPTPDTAAIGRKFSFPFAGDNEEEDEDDHDGPSGNGSEDVDMEDMGQMDGGAEQANGRERGEESAFRKWFYEHRGDFNRGWKKRRRDARKQKRQRDNRRFSQKVA